MGDEPIRYHGFVQPFGGALTTVDFPLLTGIRAWGTIISDIDNSGRLVGYYGNDLDTVAPVPGSHHGFLAAPAAVPEPNTLALLLSSGVTGLLLVFRRLRRE